MHHESTDTAPTAALNRRERRGAGISRRMLGGGLAVLIGVAGLSACTQDEPEPKPTATASATADPGITDITDTPGSGENLVGALADTQITTCELAGDHWDVAGTVTNPTDAAASYRIYVSLLTAGGDTRSLTQVNVDAVAAGAETEWSTQVALAEKDLNCVLRVERYADAAEQPAEDEGGEDGEG